MKLLAIDTAGQTASVAVLEDDTLLAEYTINYHMTHSQTIMPMIEQICNMIKLNKNEIDLNEIYEKLRKMNFNLIFENNYNNVKKYMQNNYTENMKKIL